MGSCVPPSEGGDRVLPSGQLLFIQTLLVTKDSAEASLRHVCSLPPCPHTRAMGREAHSSV